MREYISSPWLKKLQSSRIIVGLDQDDSFALPSLGSPEEPSDVQLAARARTRHLLRKKGVVEMAQSMRSWELMISSKVYEQSAAIADVRPPPRRVAVRTSGGETKFVFHPLEEIHKFDDCLNWDALLVPGNGIALRNGRGYVIDKEYDHELRFSWGDGSDPRAWRDVVMEFVEKLDPMAIIFFSTLELEANYREGNVDVLTLPYRIQMDFQGEEGFVRKEDFKSRLKAAFESEDPLLRIIARRIKTIDESNPAKYRYTLYLVPWKGRKESLLNRFVRQSCKAAGLPTSELKLLLVGDTLTDLRAGLYGGTNADVSFLLPENSRLTPYVREWLSGEPALWALEFAGEPLKRLMSRLRPTNRKGRYTFEVATRGKHPNTFVFGAEAYPGKEGAVAVEEFLQDELH